MKILIEYQPNKKLDNYEGARLRKTVKGALELLHIPYITEKNDNFDAVMCFNPNHDARIRFAHELGKTAIVFALYAEGDDRTSYLDYKDAKITLKPRSLRLLNDVDLIIVPTTKAKDCLVSNGINTPIKILHPGVNISRFDYSREDEKEIFYKYFRISNNNKNVIIVGEYRNNYECIKSLVDLANSKPNANFYFISNDKKENASFKTKIVIKKSPQNIKFVDPIPDDVYRSGLMNADIFVLTGKQINGTITLMDAMAAKTQIVMQQPLFDQKIVNNNSAYVVKDSEELVDKIKSYLNGELQPTILNAYSEAKNNSIQIFGEKLVNIISSIETK